MSRQKDSLKKIYYNCPKWNTIQNKSNLLLLSWFAPHCCFNVILKVCIFYSRDEEVWKKMGNLSWNRSKLIWYFHKKQHLVLSYPDRLLLRTLKRCKNKNRIDNTKYVTQSTQTKWIKSFTNGSSLLWIFFSWCTVSQWINIRTTSFNNKKENIPATHKGSLELLTWEAECENYFMGWESVTKPENRANFTHWMMWGMDVFAETWSCSSLILNICDRKEVDERYGTLPGGEMYISSKYLFSNSKLKLHSGGYKTLPRPNHPVS